jgi:hypothetical protein
MTEIEKMFENAGFSKKQCKDYSCIVCEQNNSCEKYPPFTAEKQIELIKWLIQKNFYDERIIRSNYEKTSFYCSYLDDYCESEEFEKFEEALANVFNYFWQSLTYQEKEEIRSILNG